MVHLNKGGRRLMGLDYIAVMKMLSRSLISLHRDKGGQKGVQSPRVLGKGLIEVGIISALAFSTDYSGLYAAGSFSGAVSLYQEDHDGSVGHIDGIEPGGVTQVCLNIYGNSRLTM
jgi:hypothetical protein